LQKQSPPKQKIQFKKLATNLNRPFSKEDIQMANKCAEKWMELENIILNDVRQAWKANCHIFPYVEYRPTANAAVLRNTGHTKGRSHSRGVG
jgi:hypothetical protein